MSTIANVTTAEQLLATNLQHCELIAGELVMMSPAGFDHGRFASRIVTALENHVSRQGLGIVTTAEAGFQLARDPDTVRAPDVAFVRADRIPPGGVKGYFQGAPDLAVEVVSPSDRPTKSRQRCKTGSSPAAQWFGSCEPDKSHHRRPSPPPAKSPR